MHRLLSCCVALFLAAGMSAAVTYARPAPAAVPAQPGGRGGGEQAAPAQQGGGASGEQAAPTGPLAPEVYENIQVLTDVPADEIETTMAYVAAATGMECGSCHVRDEATGAFAFASDDMRSKQTARRMMRMVYAINAGDFGVRAQCATCHAGQNRPPGLQLATMATAEEIAAMEARQAAASAAPAERGGRAGRQGGGGQQRGGRGPQGPPPPEPGEIVAQYVAAVGGQGALHDLRSIAIRGTLTDRYGRSMPFTIEEKTPNRFRETVRTGDGTMVRGFDGTTGWMQEQGAVTELHGFRLQEALRVANLPVDREIADGAGQMRAGRPARIDGRPVNMLQAAPASQVTERLYFDADSGLLVRRTIITRTVLGSLSEQVDYDDYRAVGNVMLPFRITRTTWDAVDSFQIDDIQANAPIDDAIFSPPSR